MVRASCMAARSASPERGGGVRHHQQGGAQHQRPHDQGYAGPSGLPDPGQVRPQRRLLATGGADHHPTSATAEPSWATQGAERGPGDAQPSSADAVHRARGSARCWPGCRRPPPPAACGCPAGRAAPRWPPASAAAARRRAGRSAGRSPPARPPGRPGRTARRSDRSAGSTTSVASAPIRVASQSPSMPWTSAAAGVAGADLAGDRGGGAVGEEDAQADQGAEHRRGDAERRQLRGAEVADDRGVREQEQRLGDQGEEGRDGQPQDLPVLGADQRPEPADWATRSLPRGEARRQQNLCKTRVWLWVSALRAALSTNKQGDPRWRTGEHQQARKLSSTGRETAKPQVRGRFGRENVFPRPQRGQQAAHTQRRRVPHDQQGYPQVPVDEGLGERPSARLVSADPGRRDRIDGTRRRSDSSDLASDFWVLQELSVAGPSLLVRMRGKGPLG